MFTIGLDKQLPEKLDHFSNTDQRRYTLDCYEFDLKYKIRCNSSVPGVIRKENVFLYFSFLLKIC